MRCIGLGLTVVGCAVAISVPISASAQPRNEVFAKAAANQAGLGPTIEAYRAALDNPDNLNNPPSAPGRREINWDGVPNARAAPNLMPPNFFNTKAPRPRGAVFSTSDNRFQVSATQNNRTRTPVRFGNLNPQYPQVFATFSAQRLFTAVDSNQLTVHFFVPGTTQRATVNGFGAVFTDVDRPGTTWLEYFDWRGRLLFRQQVPPGPVPQRSLSFAGVKRSVSDIFRVRITSGNVVLSPQNPDGGQRDAVAMDDLLYGEPRRLP
jgi:hypothetical protein